MLRSIPGWKLIEWQLFDELEPPDGERADWQFARIVQALIRDGKLLKDFVLPFGDTPGPEPIQQPVAYQEMLIDAWVAGSNAMFKAKGRAH